MGIPGIPTGPTLPSLKLVVVSIITVIFNIVFFNNLGPLTSRPNETLYHRAKQGFPLRCLAGFLRASHLDVKQDQPAPIGIRQGYEQPRFLIY